ncbi:cytochrome c oxidase subunit VB-domain-containing protein [Kockiozyma suomiensis]|uniref:cytochrome c oxidase subunit VB-domain-containing protein n=1 Tax=Kockiozyma suomiensis TaxID=1337062 RepID=UPI003343A9B0
MIARQVLSVARVASRSVAVRSAPVAAVRSFSVSAFRANAKHSESSVEPTPTVSLDIEAVKSDLDLFGPGAQKGLVPTNLEQATGLERLEMLADLTGVDLFDETPLPSDRLGTIADPIVLESPVEQKYIGCTGIPADTHEIEWMNATIHDPARCIECGCVYKLEFVGPLSDLEADHGHH